MNTFKKYLSIIQEMKVMPGLKDKAKKLLPLNKENFFIKDFSFSFPDASLINFFEKEKGIKTGELKSKKITGTCYISYDCPQLRCTTESSIITHFDEKENKDKVDDYVLGFFHSFGKKRKKEIPVNFIEIEINLPMPGGSKKVSLFERHKKELSPNKSLMRTQMINSHAMMDSFKFNLDVAFFDKEKGINYWDIVTPFYDQLNKEIFAITRLYNDFVDKNEKKDINTSN